MATRSPHGVCMVSGIFVLLIKVSTVKLGAGRRAWWVYLKLNICRFLPVKKY